MCPQHCNDRYGRISARCTSDRKWPRLCKNAVLFQFQGSSYPSEAKNNRIQSFLRGRYLTARLRDEFLHGLIWTPPGLPS